MNAVAPVPNQNDELVRYDIQIDTEPPNSCASKIIEELTAEGYEKSCTIRSMDAQILHADLLTADIKLRRQLHDNAT